MSKVGNTCLYDSWVVPNLTKVGYEISFAKQFDKHAPLMPLYSIMSAIRALEEQSTHAINAIAEAIEALPSDSNDSIRIKFS